MARHQPCIIIIIGSIRSGAEHKQVMFSDGIRPGGDLTELDGVDEVRSSSGRRIKTVDKSSMFDC